jgi:hypothetical protein
MRPPEPPTEPRARVHVDPKPELLRQRRTTTCESDVSDGGACGFVAASDAGAGLSLLAAQGEGDPPWRGPCHHDGTISVSGWDQGTSRDGSSLGRRTVALDAAFHESGREDESVDRRTLDVNLTKPPPASWKQQQLQPAATASSFPPAPPAHRRPVRQHCGPVRLLAPLPGQNAARAEMNRGS